MHRPSHGNMFRIDDYLSLQTHEIVHGNRITEAAQTIAACANRDGRLGCFAA